MSARIGIVVLNWNGGWRTVACLDSLAIRPHADQFVVLVDSHSRPQEREQLLQRYGQHPAIHCCFLDDNRGYAGGMNVGMRAALARGADAVVIATQDVTFGQNAVTAMAETAQADGRIGIVGPKIVDARPPHRVLSIGERVSVPWLCVPRTLLRYRRARPTWYAVGGVLGCAMLLTRPCLEAIGRFDEEFFAYYEEVDLCLRARRHGFRVVCNPQAVVTHDGARGFLGGFTALSAELKARNLLRLMGRWATPADWLVLAPTYALLLGGSIGLYALRGRTEIVASLLSGVAAGLRQRGGAPRHSAHSEAEPLPSVDGELGAARGRNIRPPLC